LDIEGIIVAAKASGANAIHPGYGLLSETSEFAKRCAEESIVWIGPPVEMLELFGDKSAARTAAASADVPVPRGIDRAITLAECEEFFGSVADAGGIMIKAIAGAGGRGSRKVTAAEDVAEAFAACQREATGAFGNGDLCASAPCLLLPAFPCLHNSCWETTVLPRSFQAHFTSQKPRIQPSPLAN
jgi:pyruvate carboxylase